jgi:hypothetical protein
MSMIINASRFLLFGPKLDSRITLANVAKRKGLNLVRGVFGMPPVGGPGFIDWLIEQGKKLWAILTGRHPDALPLPDDLPVSLFNTINETLKNRGGLHDKDLGLPNFWCSPTRATSTPFFWSLVVDYSSAADPAKVQGFEMALEDQLTKAGFDYNVRIQRRPLRIEIDKPRPPVITLAELWPTVAAYPQNARWAVLGLAYMGGESTTLSISLEGEDFSAFVAGSPGSGKTQLSMSILLSLAMTNSPDSLSMVIVDPKAVDFRPFNALPHLALPVVNEPLQAADVVAALCDEMDRRTACAARGDNSFFAHTILLYVDELADLAMSLPESQSKALTNNIQRLGQKGRGVGFIILGATQRVYDIDASMHSKLNARIVGKMRTAGDSVAASGVPGTTTNKLPGKGSFELYCSDQQGLRIQAPFVAASDKPGYEAKLKPFFADITQRWGNIAPGWTPNAEKSPKDQAPTQPPAQDATGTTDQADQVADAPTSDQEGEPVTKIEIDARIWQRMTQAYADGKLSGNMVRKFYQEVLAKSISGTKAKEILDAFTDAMQDAMSTSGD